jgi:regulator of protease activity HflC (stomatin/prohibitin superfamily)
MASIRNFVGNHKIFFAILLILITAFSLGTIVLGIRTVPSGSKGVVTQWGSITGTVDDGFHWVNIWLGQDIVNLDCQIHKVEIANESIGTIDQQEAWGTVSINYQLEAGYVSDIYKTLRLEWEDRVILNNMRESLKSTTAQYKADEFLLKREQVKVYFLNLLRERMEQYHIYVIDVQLENFQFSQQYQDQVNKRSLAEQKALEEQLNLEIIKYQQQQEVLKKESEATMAKIQAEADANVTLTKANADYQKVLLEAQAQAEAQRLLNQQLTEIYIHYLALRQWDGKLPYFWGSDSPIPFIGINPETPVNPTP